LRNLKDIYYHHREEIHLIKDSEAKVNKLVEINVVEQVHNLIKTGVVQKAWRKGNNVTIHGWVYDMETGIIKSLLECDKNAEFDSIYRYDFGDESDSL